MQANMQANMHAFSQSNSKSGPNGQDEPDKYDFIGSGVYHSGLAQTALAIGVDTYSIFADAKCETTALEAEGFGEITHVYDCKIVDETIKDDAVVREQHIMQEHLGTTRAVIALKPHKGRCIVAIAFNGTNYTEDWMINLQLAKKDLKHEGFDKNTRDFAKVDNDIYFESLGKSLRQVCCESRQSGKYRFFLSGHSLGAAVLQLYVAEFMMGKYGVKKEHICGYAFASPCPVDKDYYEKPEVFPVFNILSTDDPVIRAGSLSSILTGRGRHLGKELFYSPDEAFRKKCYFRSGITQGWQLLRPRPFSAVVNYLLDVHELLASYKEIVDANLAKEPAK